MHPDHVKQNTPTQVAKINLWVRLGVNIRITQEDFKKVQDGHVNIVDLIKNNHTTITGDSYAPQASSPDGNEHNFFVHNNNAQIKVI